VAPKGVDADIIVVETGELEHIKVKNAWDIDTAQAMGLTIK
jgi:hypothetical protein